VLDRISEFKPHIFLHNRTRSYITSTCPIYLSSTVSCITDTLPSSQKIQHPPNLSVTLKTEAVHCSKRRNKPPLCGATLLPSKQFRYRTNSVCCLQAAATPQYAASEHTKLCSAGLQTLWTCRQQGLSVCRLNIYQSLWRLIPVDLHDCSEWGLALDRHRAPVVATALTGVCVCVCVCGGGGGVRVPGVCVRARARACVWCVCVCVCCVCVACAWCDDSDGPHIVQTLEGTTQTQQLHLNVRITIIST
jgi:hypothetical protein